MNQYGQFTANLTPRSSWLCFGYARWVSFPALIGRVIRTGVTTGKVNVRVTRQIAGYPWSLCRAQRFSWAGHHLLAKPPRLGMNRFTAAEYEGLELAHTKTAEVLQVQRRQTLQSHPRPLPCEWA